MRMPALFMPEIPNCLRADCRCALVDGGNAGEVSYDVNELLARQAARYLAPGQDKGTRQAARNLPDQIEEQIPFPLC